MSGIEWPRRRPTASTRSGAQESVERYYTNPSASEIWLVADERKPDSCSCWPRYVGRCYCAAGGAR